MLIVLDKTTNEIKNNHGINPLFPDGNIPNLEPNENELFVRLDDNSYFAKQIMSAYEYTIELDGNNEITNVTINKTLEEYRAEQPVEPQAPSDKERIESLEEALLLLMMEG